MKGDWWMEKSIKEILAKMSLRQKASLLYGRDFWYVDGTEAGFGRIMMTDGPSGLRKQCGESDMIGLNESIPATAFPCAACAACSWDPQLLERMGRALGEECVKENVAVLLGPAVNHKRDPRGGRNFEYFSEDPCLTGILGAAVVNGVQSTGVGVSLKHFACNSQEDARMFEDSLVDERALREIYLKQFEYIVKNSQPATIMTAYNKVDGVHCSENERLMKEIARDEWGFEGIFVTDWSAMRDQVAAYRAGLDLEMPGTVGSDEDLEEAVKAGMLTEKEIDEHAARLIKLFLHSQEVKTDIEEDMYARHLDLAQKIAEESCVLLKNKGVLPILQKDDIALIGAFAKQPRFQGGGSSRVNPVSLENVTDCFEREGIHADYAVGYFIEQQEPDEIMISEAAAMAAKHKITIVFAGQFESNESEGFDRKHIRLPASQDRLIDAVAEANPNTIVVLACGAPVEMPWADKVGAVLLTYLGGCRVAAAATSILFGKSNPSGKLAETFPFSLDDVPAYAYYGKHEDYAEYRESIYTGYRWYDSAKKQVLFPFGHGLSYTSFEYGPLAADKKEVAEGQTLTVSCTVKNTGNCDGKEIIQLYVSQCSPSLFKPEKELKAFAKAELVAGETKTIRFDIPYKDFAFYNPQQKRWQVEKGEYQILVGASSRDVRQRLSVNVEGDIAESIPDYRSSAPCYYRPDAIGAEIPQEQFLTLAQKKKPCGRDRTVITKYSPVKDLRCSKGGKPIYDSIVKRASSNPDPVLAKTNLLVALDMPVMNIFMGNVRRGEIQEFVDKANGKK